MSHFAILAVRKAGNPISYEEAMERYNECAEVEPYIYKTYEEAAKAGKERLGRLVDDEKIKDLTAGMSKDEWIAKHSPVWDSEEYAKYAGETYERYTKKLELVKKYLDGTVTDKECHDFYCEEEDRVDKDGNILSTYNPESKWDWYSIGGRWSGELKIKKSKVKKYGSKEVDEALKGDIDWAAMNSITPEQREHAKRFWKYYVMEEPYPGTDEEKKKELGFTFYTKEYYLKRYKTIEGYLKSLSTWYLRAVLDDDGEWHEVGEMGWFGMSSESEDEDAKWEEEFYDRFIKPLPEDAVLTVIDCHI